MSNPPPDELFAQYWDELRQSPTVAPPAGLEPEVAAAAQQLQPPDPNPDFVAQLHRRLLAVPALDVAEDRDPAPLLHAGLPIRLARPRFRFAPALGAAAMLLILVLGGTLFAGILSGRSRSIGAGGGTELTSASEIIRQAKLISDTLVPSFSATVVMTNNPSAAHSPLRQSSVWHQAPANWRVEYNDTNLSSPAPLSPLTSTYIVKGPDRWSYMNPYAAGNMYTDHFLEPLEVMLHGDWFIIACQNPDLHPRLRGNDIVAGRDTYIVDLGAVKCAGPARPDDEAISATVWIDKQTFFVLKWTAQTKSYRPSETIMVVTNIQYNPDLNPNLFVIPTPVPPTPIPTATPMTLAQARAMVPFPVYVPTYVPEGMSPEPPLLQKVNGQPDAVRVFFHRADGTPMFRVYSSVFAAGDDMDKYAHDTATQSNTYISVAEPITLPNGLHGYFFTRPVGCILPRLSLDWTQDGNHLAITAEELPNGEFGLTREQMIAIAVSMSPTAELRGVSPARPPTNLPDPNATTEACPPSLRPNAGLPDAEPTGGPRPSPRPTPNPNNY